MLMTLARATLRRASPRALGAAVPRRPFSGGDISPATASDRAAALIDAIKAGDDDFAADMLAEPAPIDLDLSDPYGSTALTLASRGGFLELVRHLLAREPPPPINAQNAFGSTALMCAAASGHADVCTVLLAREDVDVDVRTQFGSTALSKAAEAGHAQIVEQLLARGADASVSNRLGHTAAELAANRGHSETARLLAGVGGAAAAGSQPDSADAPPAPRPPAPSAPLPLVSATVCGLRAGSTVCKLDSAVQGPPGTVLAARADGLPRVLPVNEKVRLRRDPDAKPQGWLIVEVVPEDSRGRVKQRCLHPRRPYAKKCVDCPDKRLSTVS